MESLTTFVSSRYKKDVGNMSKNGKKRKKKIEDREEEEKALEEDKAYSTRELEEDF